MLRTRSPLGLPEYCYSMDLVRLACVKHAASVRPEPGSNSPSRICPPARRPSESIRRAGSTWLRLTDWHRVESSPGKSVRARICAFNELRVGRSGILPKEGATRWAARTRFVVRPLFRCQGAFVIQRDDFVSAGTHPLGVGPGCSPRSRRCAAGWGEVTLYG